MPGGASVRRRPVPRRLLSGWPPSPAAGMRPGRAGPTGFSGRGGSRAGRSRGRSSAAPVPARRAHAGVALTHRPAGPARPAAPGAPGVHASGPGTIPAPSRQGPGAPGLTAGRWGWQPSWCPGTNATLKCSKGPAGARWALSPLKPASQEAQAESPWGGPGPWQTLNRGQLCIRNSKTTRDGKQGL
ncbi:uncharacterized protein [Sagmatias obliquidens]|uniref:uncharacterized protein isoform X3 n=1 Tax=Sagmatias obliquidens TaxID=3371155 RepID=UPI000F44101D|nr:uncharacterized protein LOC113627716 isoform X3 [Lagenorhynchus obliquidens]